jgi:hypothetical protein
MIGVVADPREHSVVREFFELFKTPWEFHRKDRDYQVVLCAGEPERGERAARIVLIYSGGELAYDGRAGLAASAPAPSGEAVRYRNTAVPVYGRSIRFRDPGQPESGAAVVRLEESATRQVVRLGYDLFREVAYLLTEGQPASNAGIAALELHIAILRDLIVSSGAALSEIPPVPAGYNFIACLTHDVDHPSIRRHGLDHTTIGFVWRAIAGSIARCWQGRLRFSELLRNWAAALKLPFVQAGIAADFWAELSEYRALEQGASSTFFVIPFEGRAGRLGAGAAPHFRRARYGAADIAAELEKLAAAGCEVGVHGIDAWHDSALGRQESAELRRVMGERATGIRMHWLYFDKNSPGALEDAGFEYDSTCGYNETIGYRAGTTQVYRPPQTRKLLELPLHVMDTSLFYRQHLDFSPAEAKEAVAKVVSNTARLGGCVTLNWHDRSIAPERLWGEFYGELIVELKRKGAWLASAEQVVAWFQQRRAMAFRHGSWAWEPEGPAAGAALRERQQLPGVQVRVHNGSEALPGTAPRAVDPDCVVTAN